MPKDNLPKVFKSKTPKTYKNKKLNNANFGNFTGSSAFLMGIDSKIHKV